MLDKSLGLISASFVKDPGDPQWSDDRGMRDWLAWMRKYVPGSDPANGLYAGGYIAAQLLVQTLRQCGDDIGRPNIMRQALNLNLDVPVLLPGIRARTSVSDRYTISKMQLARFNGRYWELFGPVRGG